METIPKNIFYFFGSNLRYIANPVFLKTVSGLENLPQPPFILACNHISVPDGWVISNLMVEKFKQPAWFLVRDDFWLGKRWSRFIAPLLGGIIVDFLNPKKSIEKSIAVLKSGGIVGIFPEGTRNPDKVALAQGKTGVARIALCSKCPVVPVGYFGPKIETFLDIVKNFILKRQKSSVVFGRPVYLSEYFDKNINLKILEEITDTIMIEIGRLCGKKPRLRKKYEY